MRRPAEKKPRPAAAVIDAMVDSVVVLDLDGNVIAINHAYEKMWGYKREESIGKHILELPGIKSVKPEDIEKFMPLLKEAIEKGSIAPVELVFPTKDGRMIPVTLAGGVIKDDQGNPTHVVAVLRDITELKRAEEERAEAETALERAKIIEAMPIGVVTMDLNGTILDANETSDKMFGYEKGEAIGKSCTDFIVEEDVPRALEAIQEVVAKGYYRGFEATGIRKDGSRFTILVDGTLIRDRESNPHSILLTYRDITELKRAEEEKVAAFKRAADTIEAMIDPVIIYDLEGKVMQVNKAIEAYGYTKEELIGKSPLERWVPERNRSRVAEGFKKALENGSITRDVEVTLLTKDGKEVPFVVSGVPLRDREGKQICRIEILKDISKLRQLERESEAAYKARIEELEKFAKLTTGREQRIIELKRQVKELEEKLKAK